jgi:dolichol-phosphate mannosyltransferase
MIMGQLLAPAGAKRKQELQNRDRWEIAIVSVSPQCDVSVVVPTYCEADNLPLLVPRIAAALDAARLRGEILIIDDDSPDATPRVCEQLATVYPVRLLIRRGERGLSGAVLHGMHAAVGAVLVVMDADLSHPPEAIPALVDAVRSGRADFAIGSRYVRGGKTDASWGVLRRLNSKVAALLARPLTRAHDPLAGFFAIRQTTFAAGGPFDSVGFKIGLELMVRCDCRRIAEIPIVFHNRQLGFSKLNWREQVNYLRHLQRLYAFQWFGPASRPLSR